jgi:hypothetical protein
MVRYHVLQQNGLSSMQPLSLGPRWFASLCIWVTKAAVALAL